ILVETEVFDRVTGVDVDALLNLGSGFLFRVTGVDVLGILVETEVFDRVTGVDVDALLNLGSGFLFRVTEVDVLGILVKTGVFESEALELRSGFLFGVA
ncbi:MAG: hypothetical protein LBH49_02955, partial [Puniceicoccales bacterium]|nr:hypothetical protein [Puniceicoccales bacterium]